MVVGTHVKDGVVFAVIPAGEFVIGLGEGEEARTALAVHLLSLVHLREQPRARYHSVGFQQFDIGCGAHLARYDALQVAFHGQFVDGTYLVFLDHQSQRAGKHLRLGALPVEVDADGHVAEGKRRILMLWMEGKLAVQVAVPTDAALGELHFLSALNLLALGHIRAVEVDADALGAHDAYRHHGFGSSFGLGNCLGGGSEAGSDASELLSSDTTLAEEGSRSVGVDTVKVCLAWGDDEAGHVYSSRADQILGVALGRVAVGTMLGARDDDGDVALVLLP